MTHGFMMATILVLAAGFCRAEDVTLTGGEPGFIRDVIGSLLEGGSNMTFAVADRLVALDNGETLSREDLKKAWPEIARGALTKKVAADQFFRDVEVRVLSPLQNKRLMSDKRVLESYTHQDGDLYIDASQVRAGAESFIANGKAFLFLIRKVGGQWTLIGIGG